MKKVLFPLLLLTLISCTRAPETTHSTKKKLRINLLHEPPTLDPRRCGDSVSSLAQYMLYEGLTRYSPNSRRVELGMAKRYELSEDGLTYTFYLKDARWSDGAEVTSQDFLNAWKTSLSPLFPAPDIHLFYFIKNAEAIKKGEKTIDTLGVRAIDSKTLEIRVEKPTHYTLDLLAFPCFFPVSRKVSITPYSSDMIVPNFPCNGPFKIKDRKPGNEYRFAKNRYYVESDRVKLDEIQISFVSNEMTAIQMFQNKELDVIGPNNTDIPAEMLASLQKSSRIDSHDIAATTFCFFNTLQGPLQNAKIRRAFMLACNRKKIVEDVTGHDETPATQMLPKILRELPYSKTLFEENIVHAKNEFQEGLEEIGMSLKAFPPITLTYFESSKHKKVAQVLQEQWRKTLGVDVRLEGTSVAIFVNKLQKKDFQAALCPIIAQYKDPMNYFERFLKVENPKNYPTWHSEMYTALIESVALARRAHEREAIYDQAEAMIAQECPFFGVFHWNYKIVSQSNVTGIYVSPIGSIHYNYANITEEDHE